MVCLHFNFCHFRCLSFRFQMARTGQRLLRVSLEALVREAIFSCHSLCDEDIFLVSRVLNWENCPTFSPTLSCRFTPLQIVRTVSRGFLFLIMCHPRPVAIIFALPHACFAGVSTQYLQLLPFNNFTTTRKVESHRITTVKALNALL